MAERLYMTAQRQAIYEIVKQADDHPTAAEIIERLKHHGHQFAYGTVYNSLRYLTDSGLIRELKLGDAASRYDGEMEDHQHVVCTSCGRVDEVFTALPQAWFDAVRGETRYTLADHQVILTGTCPDCHQHHEN